MFLSLPIVNNTSKWNFGASNDRVRVYTSLKLCPAFAEASLRDVFVIYFSKRRNKSYKKQVNGLRNAGLSEIDKKDKCNLSSIQVD